MMFLGRLLACLVWLGIVSAPVAATADDEMVWQFFELNDPDNKGAMTARLVYGVPETDNTQVMGVCDARPSTGVKTSSVIFGADIGDLEGGKDVTLRFSGGGFDHALQGQIHRATGEEGLNGVHVDIAHSDPLWDAMSEKKSLDYLVAGYRAATINLERGRDKIGNYVEACRTYAAAILGTESAAQVVDGQDSAQKSAFDSAKELGTEAAWQAFLTSYPTGFYADLARAYVKQLEAGSAEDGVTGLNVTLVRYAKGTFVKNGPDTWVEQGESGSALFRFNESSRTEREVRLFDPSRKVNISLSIATGEILNAPEGSPLAKLYDIVETRSNESPAQTPVAAPVAAAVGSDPNCKDRTKLRSQNSDTPVKITFINKSGMYRGILWLDFSGQPKDYANLQDGERIELDTFLTHPWMITDGPGNCIEIVMPHPSSRIVELGGGASTAGPAPAPTPKPQKVTGCEEGYKLVKGKCRRITAREKPQGCPPGTKPVPETDDCVAVTPPKKKAATPKCRARSILIDGKCVLRRNAATYCGPGYRLQGNKCVQGYAKPAPQIRRPTWQLEAIRKGCKPGMGWNPQEGCHEND